MQAPSENLTIKIGALEYRLMLEIAGSNVISGIRGGMSPEFLLIEE